MKDNQSRIGDCIDTDRGYEDVQHEENEDETADHVEVGQDDV